MDVSENRRYKPDETGYRRFYVKPMFVRGIEEARTELESPYGKIVSCWSCRNGKIRVEVSVPANTGRICSCRKKRNFEVGSGTHVYEYDTNTSLKELKFTLDSTLGGRDSGRTSWHEDDGRDAAAGACTQSNDRVCKANDSG